MEKGKNLSDLLTPTKSVRYNIPSIFITKDNVESKAFYTTIENIENYSPETLYAEKQNGVNYYIPRVMVKTIAETFHLFAIVGKKKIRKDNGKSFISLCPPTEKDMRSSQSEISFYNHHFSKNFDQSSFLRFFNTEYNYYGNKKEQQRHYIDSYVNENTKNAERHFRLSLKSSFLSTNDTAEQLADYLTNYLFHYDNYDVNDDLMNSSGSSILDGLTKYSLFVVANELLGIKLETGENFSLESIANSKHGDSDYTRRQEVFERIVTAFDCGIFSNHEYSEKLMDLIFNKHDSYFEHEFAFKKSPHFVSNFFYDMDAEFILDMVEEEDYSELVYSIDSSSGKNFYPFTQYFSQKDQDYRLIEVIKYIEDFRFFDIYLWHIFYRFFSIISHNLKESNFSIEELKDMIDCFAAFHVATYKNKVTHTANGKDLNYEERTEIFSHYKKNLKYKNLRVDFNEDSIVGIVLSLIFSLKFYSDKEKVISDSVDITELMSQVVGDYFYGYNNMEKIIEAVKLIDSIDVDSEHKKALKTVGVDIITGIYDIVF